MREKAWEWTIPVAGGCLFQVWSTWPSNEELSGQSPRKSTPRIEASRGAANRSCAASKYEQTAGARKDLCGDEEGCREHAWRGTSTVSLCDHATYALFDPGASHSFISARFAELVGLSLRPLEVVLHVVTPLRDGVSITLGCANRKIVINGREDKIDLVVLPMYDFDVIIGMDWLGKLEAMVDYGSRTIQFNPVGRPRFEFVGSQGGTSIPLVSSLEVTKLIDEGCEAYLAIVMDSTIEEPKFEDIPVVREFPDVFPQDLSGLPPERETEFSIELINGAKPISKAPYRVSISELKELKVQMHEFLDKGFICPSASPGEHQYYS
ncbi:uncharacterized protein LOC125316462 [Rhodamnia argentea]|uniref:Uncharacterized protein LOC125316462 n=1 Tax=Rhodamnia argentea TaxID=178133 RepID=A0ABM3HVZ1_9MYRT|nr:uncharacterized protein LOC125316462 [Rhodamnia argentea]